MSSKSVWVGGWFYFLPTVHRDSEGRIILIEKRSFGPLEAYDWGIDAGNKPFEEYCWCEDDFYEDSHYFKHITKQELTEQMENLIGLFTENALPEWAGNYREILDWLNSYLS